VATASIQVRLAGVFGRLVNISSTGALVHVSRALSAGRDWPILLNVEPEPVELRGRVVRSDTVRIELPGATWQRQEYAVAIAFTALPPVAKEALKKLCGEAFSQRESHNRTRGVL
jgi:hypothetical protein